MGAFPNPRLYCDIAAVNAGARKILTFDGEVNITSDTSDSVADELSQILVDSVPSAQRQSTTTERLAEQNRQDNRLYCGSRLRSATSSQPEALVPPLQHAVRVCRRRKLRAVLPLQDHERRSNRQPARWAHHEHALHSLWYLKFSPLGHRVRSMWTVQHSFGCDAHLRYQRRAMTRLLRSQHDRLVSGCRQLGRGGGATAEAKPSRVQQRTCSKAVESPKAHLHLVVS
eukprot:s520_g20.t1